MAQLDGRPPVPNAKSQRMPVLELNDGELADAAQAARAAAYRALEDAGKQGSPSIKAAFDASAARYRALAEKARERETEPAVKRVFMT